MELNWLLRGASQRAVRRYLSPASTLEVQIDISRICNSNRWAAVQEIRPHGVRRLGLGLLLDRREPGRSTEIPLGNRSETRRRSATASFTKTSSNYCARGAKEMPVIKSLLTAD